jgi:Tfp pilus assembly protein PilF/DNA-binding transcriptional MerR regulator
MSAEPPLPKDAPAADQAAPPGPLAGHHIAVTGTLASMTHREAHERVVACGGTASEHVSRHTTMLVVGEEGWPLEPDGRPSVKLLHAERLRSEGVDIEIVGERTWLGFVGLADRGNQVSRRYTPAMLSQLLGINVHEIRRWERQGLIRAVSRVCRLPYFDLREVAGARRLAQLVESGVPVSTIRESLARLRQLMPGIEQPLAEVEVRAGGKQVVVRDEGGGLKTVTGQRVFDFGDVVKVELADDARGVLPFAETDTTGWTAIDWLAHARERADAQDLDRAVEAFRMGLMEAPDDALAHFQLAETLYRQGNTAGALERYHVAVELDREYVEAWTQIGCLYAELHETDQAIDAFRIALALHPDCAEAHLHLAESLTTRGDTAPAVEHWRKYLDYDQCGPWADSARQKLAELDRGTAT